MSLSGANPRGGGGAMAPPNGNISYSKKTMLRSFSYKKTIK